MAFRTFANTDEAADYAASLDERWPDRAAVRKHLSAQLDLGSTRPANVIEFCSGAGALAAQLLADHPHLHLIGLDVTPTLLDLARNRFAAEEARTQWIETDLNQDGWQSLLPHPIAAFVSLQSLHDLGDLAAVERVLRVAAEHLAPGGQMVYADMLVNPAEPQPGKTDVTGHLDLLRAAGFINVECTLEIGPFGCFCAEVAA